MKTSDTRVKRALLIGINEYPHFQDNLDGCVNDVALMGSLLQENFGFSSDHITTLTNQDATRDGILGAFDALIDSTGRDDIVVIHYSGHGSQMTDREGDEPSGLDSTIAPTDTGRKTRENRDITDDEINLKLEALCEKTQYVTLIFDSCHSGTITRDVFSKKTRACEPDTRDLSQLPASPIPVNQRRGVQERGPSGWMPLTDKYVLIAACRDDEKAGEYEPAGGEGAGTHGALTYFLCEQLRRATPGTTYRGVFERATAMLNAEGYRQHPQMEGRSDREIFGVAEIEPSRFVRIVGREDRTVTLSAGAAHGATIGSTYRVYAEGTSDPNKSTPLGEIEVVKVRSLAAEAQINTEEQPGAIAVGTRAFESTHAFGDFRLAVWVEAATEALRLSLDRSPLLKIVPTGNSAFDARVSLQDGRYAVLSATGELLMPLKASGDEATVAENLARIAKYRHALALDNPDPASRLRGHFELQILRREGTLWSIGAAPSSGGQLVFEEGDEIAFRITSHHDRAAYISLVDFGINGRISAVYPARGAQEVLAAGRTFDLWTDVSARLTWPEDVSWGREAADRVSEGIETVKLFVTSEPVDFSALEQAGVRSLHTASPLSALLRAAFHGSSTRSAHATPLGEEDWTTASRSFVLRRKRRVSKEGTA
jgi:hypothetical protein